MKLGMDVGLGSGHIVLDGDSAPPKRGTASSIFGPCQWPNGWMDQDATSYGGRPRPRPHSVRWRPSSFQKGGTAAPNFATDVCCGQTAAWIKMPLRMEVGLGPGHIVLDENPTPIRTQFPNFRPMSVVAKTAGWIKMPLGMEVGFGPGHIVLDDDPAPLKRTQHPHGDSAPRKEHSSPPVCSAHVYYGQTVAHLGYC